MKSICLSFDDARLDTYTNAFRILEKYDLKATVNVISGFIMGTYNLGSKLPMTVGQLEEWQQAGNEIACHGSTHQNTKEDVIKNIMELSKMGFDTSLIGFASPNSSLTNNNIHELGLEELYKSKKLCFLRSGIQVRREGLLYTGLSVLEMVTHNNSLFCYLNKGNTIKAKAKPLILPSVAIKKYTTLNEIYALVSKMKDEDKLILMFHSILYPKDKGYGEDAYYWNAELFEKLCESFSNNSNIKVCTTIEIMKEIWKNDKGSVI